MEKEKKRLQTFALTMTAWVGSPASIVAHSFVFAGSFAFAYFGIVSWDRMLLVLTTLVSLEAIYLAIFIQMSLNYTTQTLEVVEENIDEIQEDIDEIQEDVDEIQEDIDEIQEDVDEIQEDVDGMEESEEADVRRKQAQKDALDEIRATLAKLANDIEKVSAAQK